MLQAFGSLKMLKDAPLCENGGGDEPEHSECKHDDEHQGGEDANVDEVARVEARGRGCGHSFSFHDCEQCCV